MLSSQQKLKVEQLLNTLRAGLKDVNGFTTNDAIKFMVENGISASNEEAVFLMKLLCGNNVIIKDNNNNIYRFNESFQVNKCKDCYWMTFIPKLNCDNNDNGINVQPSIPSMSSVMQYAKIYNDKYAPKETLGVTPIDKYNLETLSNVHPSISDGYIMPNPIKKYNLVAIGAGAAGLVSAIGASRLGGKSAIIDEHCFGGDCLNTGCVPSKALLKSAKLLYDLKVKNKKNKFGINIDTNLINKSIDFGQIMERMRKVRATISHHDAVSRFQNDPYNIDCYLGRAKFVNSNCIKVNDKLIYFDKCVICTGAISNVPPINGINNINYLTSHSIWNLQNLPLSLGIIGCGPIGCEMAQSFALFGSNVIMIDLMPRILNKEDNDAADIVYKSMIDCGVKFVLGNRVIKVFNKKTLNGKKNICVVLSNGKEYEFEHLMIATGRKPNVENMDLEKANIKYDTVNGIIINDFCETSSSNIYAAGDCCNKFQFTHMVDSMAKIVVPNALFYGKKRVSSLIIPWCTYTFPQIAHVGLYEKDLKQRNIKYQTFISKLENNGRAICDGTDIDNGFVKIFIQENNDKILGATIVSENAGDQISEITVSMQGNIGLTSINKTIHPYPTISESIKYISDGYIGQKNEKLKPLFSSILSDRLRSKL